MVGFTNGRAAKVFQKQEWIDNFINAAVIHLENDN